MRFGRLPGLRTARVGVARWRCCSILGAAGQRTLPSLQWMSMLCRCLYGGAGKSMQAQDLLRHPHLVIGTPGRTLDFAEAGDLDLSKVRQVWKV